MNGNGAALHSRKHGIEQITMNGMLKSNVAHFLDRDKLCMVKEKITRRKTGAKNKNF